MRFPLALLATCSLFLTACNSTQFAQRLDQVTDLFKPSTSGTAVNVVKGTPEVFQAQKQSKKNTPNKTTTVSTQRINTTECRDADDWYLDGFRVGRSFYSQKAQMLQQRMNFCRLTQLPHAFKQNWERGFAIGAKGNNKAVRAKKA